jgi:hypothetical protein
MPYSAKLALQNVYENSSVTDEVFAELNSPCDEMHSEYMQNKYFVETLGMIEPQQVEIGQTEIACFGDNGMETKVVKRYGYVVPFLPALCKLISCPDVLTEVEKIRR